MLNDILLWVRGLLARPDRPERLVRTRQMADMCILRDTDGVDHVQGWKDQRRAEVKFFAT